MCNNLKTFDPNWFKNLSSLEELNLGGNLLTKIPVNLFKPMKNLNSIIINYNDISSIGEGAFANRNSFKFLYLEHNNLPELKPNVFLSGEIKIKYFAVNNNHLTFLSQDLLDKLSILTSIELDDNPWLCKCWEMIKNWVPVKIFRDPNQAFCVTSLSSSEYCVPLVDNELIEHFTSDKDPSHYNKNTYCR